MWSGNPLFPQAASTVAGRVDALYFFLVALTLFFVVLIGGLVVFFAIKYRRRSPDEIGARIHGGLILEIAWSVIPLIISLGIFAWSADLFFTLTRVPDETMNIYVVGKQWMWKIQHLDGQREINQLHIPVGRKVKLIMTSEDVIHDFFIPEFRVKTDVIPGRYTTIWFEATKPGTYRLFCAEYCGNKHSGMIGEVIVQEANDFQAWMSGGLKDRSLVSAGETLFSDLACITCHRTDTPGRGPSLPGVFGSSVALMSGGTATADEAYIRESILNPAAKVVNGFQPIMPTFQGLVSEEQLLQLIEYVKSLKAPGQSAAASEAVPAHVPEARN